MTVLIFDQVKASGHFHKCESKAKNIADTGAKTFTYAGPDGEGSCTYNYTENKPVSALTDTLYAIAYTLDEGRHLEEKHRFDRLGLDQEMRQLDDAIKAGRALEVQNIEPALTAIANDPQVLERVRNRSLAILATLPDTK